MYQLLDRTDVRSKPALTGMLPSTAADAALSAGPRAGDHDGEHDAELDVAGGALAAGRNQPLSMSTCNPAA